MRRSGSTAAMSLQASLPRPVTNLAQYGTAVIETAVVYWPRCRTGTAHSRSWV